jgi:FkbH-like protein
MHNHPVAVPSSVAPAKPVKCIVWDLDNTIWHGILAENDPLSLRDGIGRIIETLNDRGILHSIASRNHPPDALARLEAFGLSQYFLHPQIGWGNKSEAILKIRQKLNIGLDAIAFVDDQAFEREEVRFSLPEVQCYDVDSIEGLPEREAFKPRFITSESAQRREMYLADARREEEEQRTGNPQAFLRSLGLTFRIDEAGPEDLQRVEELTVRTHQLNATGYTYSYEELESFMHAPDHLILVAELTDIYGSYGKIGVTLVEKSPAGWTLKLLLMSCRVMSRGVGSVLLQYIVQLAHRERQTLFAEFLPTEKNRAMLIAYKFAGFAEAGTLANGGMRLALAPGPPASFPDYIRVHASL